MTHYEERPTASQEDIISISDAILIRDLAVGTVVHLRDGRSARVSANPRDGGWIYVKTSEEAAEELVFCTEVVGSE